MLRKTRHMAGFLMDAARVVSPEMRDITQQWASF